MSVFKDPKSPFYRYDFQINGRRFFGSTKARSKKDASAVEADLRKKAKADLEQEARTGKGPLTLDVAAGRYWTEVGQHHANSDETWANLERLVGYFGTTKRMDEITDGDVAALVAHRRMQTRWGKDKNKDGKPMSVIGPATVNRTTIVPLKALFMRARRTWRYAFPYEPIWRDHWLKQPEERVRELDAKEAVALDTAVRDDYADWFLFARLTGLRRKETLITWSCVNRTTGQITTIGKGGRKVRTPITEAVAAILDRCEGHDPDHVFTYVRKQPGEGRGKRFPITPEGAKSQWRRLQAKSGVKDFRFHDIRHDVATKLLRKTGNLKLVQRALNHSNVQTTTKYAHVMDDEVAAALLRPPSRLARPRPRLGARGQATLRHPPPHPR